MELCAPDRLKVVLRYEDLLDRRLSFDLLSYDSSQTRLVIRELLDEAYRQTGFDSANGRLLIEALPLLDGGCILYFTMLSHTGSLPELPAAKPRRFGPYVYTFDSSDALMDACGRLWRERRGKILQSAAYRLGNSYRLTLVTREEQDSFDGILGEYGRLTGEGKAAAASLREHGSVLVAQGAVRTLGSL